MLLSIDGPSKGQSSHTYYPWIILSVVCLNILTSLAFGILLSFNKIIENKRI